MFVLAVLFVIVMIRNELANRKIWRYLNDANRELGKHDNDIRGLRASASEQRPIQR